MHSWCAKAHRTRCAFRFQSAVGCRTVATAIPAPDGTAYFSGMKGRIQEKSSLSVFAGVAGGVPTITGKLQHATGATDGDVVTPEYEWPFVKQ
jgi:hypothetical protein